MTVKGKVIAGAIGKIQIRQKSDSSLEIGELLIGESDAGAQLLQVVNLEYGSQVSSSNMQMIAGMALEEDTSFQFYEENLRHYTLATLKSLITIYNYKAKSSKTLPKFFTNVRKVTKEDFSFLAHEKSGLPVGFLRSGSEVLKEVPIELDLKEVLSHHVLIPATTGKGKSNLMSYILWSTLATDDCGMLVLDPHDEYYGKNKEGLKDHPDKDRVVYYSSSTPPPGGLTLKININRLKPKHFSGVMDLSSPQQQCMTAYHQKYGDEWITNIFAESPVSVHIHEDSMGVIKRKLTNVLALSYDGSTIKGRGVFDSHVGESTADDIARALENANTVIIDTSHLAGSAEILVGSILTHTVFDRYRKYNQDGTLKQKPVISVVLEEAPRVLGKAVLERGTNVFSTIAREGRKFKVGLCAITQLPSLIPKEILANMNTKIILGIEMAPERQAIIESAAQDLSDDNRNIASLDKGEAIITSNFARFATPVSIPYFKEVVKEAINKHNREKHGMVESPVQPAFNELKS
jgi:uncharacterized protein